MNRLKISFLSFLLAVLCLPGVSWAQHDDHHVLHGMVRDASSGEGVMFASIQIVGHQGGTACDAMGHFELHIPAGDYTLQISAIGYQSQRIDVSLPVDHQQQLSINLQPEIVLHDEVVISAQSSQVNDLAASPHRMNATEDLLDRVPGADFIQRANFAWEPVVRGMSGGQLGLVIDGMKIVGACVDKMDPTSAYVEVENLEKLELSKGGFDLTQASQIGGTVNFITQKPRFDKPFYADAEFGYESAAALRRGRIAGGLSRGKTSIRGSYSYKIANDFNPGGTDAVFNSGYQKNNFKIDVTRLLGNSHEVTASVLADNAWDVGYPVLLMDATLAQAKIYSFTHSWKPVDSPISSLETRIYHNSVDHWMDDFERDVMERRVMRGMNMPMYGYTRTSGGISTLDASKGARNVRITLDAYQTESFGDMWMFSLFESIPDMYLLNLGDVLVQHGALSVDYSMPLTSKLGARINARFDYSPRDVRKQEAIDILEGRWETEDLSQTYVLGNASATFEYKMNAGTRLRLAMAHVGRLPTHVENYGHYVYNYVDGYFYSGNPNLKPERSSQIDLGVEQWTDRFAIRANVFANYIQNYIVGLNDDGLVGGTATLRFRIYDNADAAVLYGAEVSSVLQLSKKLEIAGTMAYTYGQNLEYDEPMFLIPPLSGLMSIRFNEKNWWSELETRMAMPQNRVARVVAEEDGTDGYFIVNLRGSVNLGKQYELKTGVENLFDSFYHEHLSLGNLPSLGRNVYMALAVSL